jgi:hypothetical protein
MSKTHQIDLPPNAKGWLLTNMDSEERQILKEELLENLTECINLAEDSLYENPNDPTLSQATMQLSATIQSLIRGIL